MTQSILHIEKIIEYYDAPQLFLARDRFDTQYLCLLYDDTPRCKYTAIRISNDRCNDYYLGKTDLRTLFLEPEFRDEYFDVHSSDEGYLLDETPRPSITEDRLPAEGFYHDASDNDIHRVSVPKRDRSFFERLIHQHGWVAM